MDGGGRNELPNWRWREIDDFRFLQPRPRGMPRLGNALGEADVHLVLLTWSIRPTTAPGCVGIVGLARTLALGL